MRVNELPTTFEEADRLLGKRAYRQVANNTAVHELQPHGEIRRIGLLLHTTDVIVWRANGEIEYRTGGWRTVTTKQRIDHVLRAHGYNVFSKRYEWTVRDFINGEEFAFEDGDYILARTVRYDHLRGRWVDCAREAQLEAAGNLGGLSQVGAHQACGLDFDLVDTTSPTHAG